MWFLLLVPWWVFLLKVELAAGLIVLIDPLIYNYSSSIITVIHTLVLYSFTALLMLIHIILLYRRTKVNWAMIQGGERSRKGVTEPVWLQQERVILLLHQSWTGRSAAGTKWKAEKKFRWEGLNLCSWHYRHRKHDAFESSDNDVCAFCWYKQAIMFL